MDERGMICKQQQQQQRQLEDIPKELLQHIQSFLPVKQAARTCILFKTWLHIWSTNPDLTFPQSAWISSEQERKFMSYIDRTLIRYHQDNIPISTIYLDINIKDQKTASLAQNWIRLVASNPCLKELNLKIWTCVPSFTFTDKIFSSENLRRISVRLETSYIDSIWIRGDHVINCLSLQQLQLIGVNISDQVLENLLSTCKLLKKIFLLFHEGLRNIKVKDLCFLEELAITSRGRNDVVEIDNVPSLCSVYYDSTFEQRQKLVPLRSSGLLASVKELYLDGVHIDGSFSHMIKSKFPFLENLILNTRSWNPKSIDIASVSLKRLTLRMLDRGRISVQVCAPNLRCFCYYGYTISRLLFTDIVPEQVKLRLSISWGHQIDQSLFLDLREMLDLSSTFEIKIIAGSNFGYVIPDIDLDDLRKRVLFPATNVRTLSFITSRWAESLGRSRFFQVFEALLTICHPIYIKLHQNMLSKDNKLSKLMLPRLMEKKNTNVYGSDLKEVQVKTRTRQYWETIPADSWMSILDENLDSVRFKLNWSTSIHSQG